MEITKFQLLLISKGTTYRERPPSGSHKAPPLESVGCVVTADEGLQGTGRVWEHLKEWSQLAPASLNKVTRGCEALMISLQMPPLVLSPEVLDPVTLSCSAA